MTDDADFARIVSLACHDLRTPLATVYGFARTLERGGELDERSLRFVTMISEASEQMTALLDELGSRSADRGQAASSRPGRGGHASQLATSRTTSAIVTTGAGETIETEPAAVARSPRGARDRGSPLRAGRDR